MERFLYVKNWERFSKKIAHKIVIERKKKVLKTEDLAKIIESVKKNTRKLKRKQHKRKNTNQ